MNAVVKLIKEFILKIYLYLLFIFNMDYNRATLYAATGRTLLLPGWKGYFYWDYTKNELNFRNGDYHLDNKQLKEKGVMERNDWYYII